MVRHRTPRQVEQREHLMATGTVAPIGVFGVSPSVTGSGMTGAGSGGSFHSTLPSLRGPTILRTLCCLFKSTTHLRQ